MKTGQDNSGLVDNDITITGLTTNLNKLKKVCLHTVQCPNKAIHVLAAYCYYGLFDGQLAIARNLFGVTKLNNLNIINDTKSL